MQEHLVNAARSEGGNVFGGGSRAPVAITIFVKNPNATHDGCKIHYRDIGDYLTREQKLEALTEAVSIKGISDWQAITPDKSYDWIDSAAMRLPSSTHSAQKKQRQARQTMRYLDYISKDWLQTETHTSTISHVMPVPRMHSE